MRNHHLAPLTPLLPLVAVLCAVCAAQVPTDTTLVLTAVTGPAQAQIVGIDAAGAIAPFGRYPSDVLPAQAIEIDPFDRHILVAVDRGAGAARVLRLLPAGQTGFAGELVLGDLPGPCRQLAVVGDALLAVVGGSSGGVYRLPRRGGVAVQAVARPFASAMLSFSYSSVVILAWSGATAPASAPGLEYVDTLTGQVQLGPFAFNNRIGAEPTGLIDLPTALSRQLVAFADGSYWLHTAGLGDPVAVPTVPAVPSGGAAAYKQDTYGFSGLGVGGTAWPYLYRCDSGGAVTLLSAALPGAPIDLALPQPGYPQILPFGDACGAPSLQLVNGVMGPPQLGNLSFQLRVGNALPSQPVYLVWGFDDVGSGALPLPVAGCLLHVSPEHVDLTISNQGGLAIAAIPIPNVPWLSGVIGFAQWAQPVGSGFAASPAMAIQLAP